MDYCKLNAITRKDAYPLPRVDDSLEALSGSMQMVSTLDLLSGYWQVEVTEPRQSSRQETDYLNSECMVDAFWIFMQR